jgi:hypothetical protein
MRAAGSQSLQLKNATLPGRLAGKAISIELTRQKLSCNRDNRTGGNIRPGIHYEKIQQEKLRIY